MALRWTRLGKAIAEATICGSLLAAVLVMALLQLPRRAASIWTGKAPIRVTEGDLVFDARRSRPKGAPSGLGQQHFC